MDGRVLQVNVSPGGVPKLPVGEARVGRDGLDGDAHHHDTVHGGPHRAVCLFAIEAIERVRADGHPGVGPGWVGENLTTEGIELALLPVGARLAIGDEVVLELSGPANPCDVI
jgi:MOSC domain-containing protein YiiM